MSMLSDATAGRLLRRLDPARRVVPINPRVRTRTGIEIGSAYTAPPPQPGQCAAEIQQALLRKPRRERRGRRARLRRLGGKVALLLALCGLAWWLGTGRLPL
jgi:hypothetical protein